MSKVDVLLPERTARIGTPHAAGGPHGYRTGREPHVETPDQRLVACLSYVGSVLQLWSYRLAAELAFADLDAAAALSACSANGMGDSELEERCAAGFELSEYFMALPLNAVEGVYRAAFGRQSPITVVDTIPIRRCREAVATARDQFAG